MNNTVYVLASIQTNNFTDDLMQDKIREVWRTARSKNDGGMMYAVYHNYASDYRGDYTLSIATTSPLTDDTITLPHVNYTTFITTREHIFDTWEQIWQGESEGDKRRTYTIDFERYLPDARVEIFVGFSK